MKDFVLATHLIDNPAICFYYKGMEVTGKTHHALDCLVAFSMDDALAMDEESAIALSEKLNEDMVSLGDKGFTEFMVIKKVHSE